MKSKKNGKALFISHSGLFSAKVLKVYYAGFVEGPVEFSLFFLPQTQNMQVGLIGDSELSVDINNCLSILWLTGEMSRMYLAPHPKAGVQNLFSFKGHIQPNLTSWGPDH